VEEMLKRLGLTNVEARLYLALIDSGSTTVGPLLRKTGLHKATVYQSLNRLVEKGLVSYIKEGKKTHFRAVSPRVLLEGLQENERALKEALPALEARLKAGEAPQEVSVYQGVSGLRSALNMMLEELTPGGSYDDFGVSGQWKTLMPGYWDFWQREKKKRKMSANPYIKLKDGRLIDLRMMSDFSYYAPNILKIKTEKRQIIPLQFNLEQRRL
jgi:DNA-binding MarR family transcriptional regulator